MAEKKILIVDDDETILLLFERAFSKLGYHVRTAISGKSALELLYKEDIPVIFSDLNMLEMDGFELCRKIKDNRPMAVVYAMTGYASDFEAEACHKADFDDYFNKPVSLSVLLKAAEDGFSKINNWEKSVSL